MTVRSLLSKFRLLLSALPCFALASCFGLGTMYVKHEDHPRFGLGGRSVKSPDVSPFVIEAEKRKPNPTREEVLADWGKPDEKRQSGTNEIWAYNTGMGICGLTPMVGIGIPLWFPGGKEGCDIYFEQNEKRATKAVDRVTRQDGAAFVGFYDEGKKGIPGFSRLKDKE